MSEDIANTKRNPTHVPPTQADCPKKAKLVDRLAKESERRWSKERYQNQYMGEWPKEEDDAP